MSIYNKKTLIVILLLTIIISFAFYMITKRIIMIKMIYMKIKLRIINKTYRIKITV